MALGKLCHFPVFCGRVPWLYQYWPGGFMVCGSFPGTPEGSTGSCSGFKNYVIFHSSYMCILLLLIILLSLNVTQIY